MNLILVACDADIEIPTSLVVCPICGAPVVVEVTGWKLADDGSWYASEGGVHVNCSTEPDIDDDAKWRDWMDGHWAMPYVDWLPIQKQVRAWINEHYRFDMETRSALPDRGK